MKRLLPCFMGLLAVALFALPVAAASFPPVIRIATPGQFAKGKTVGTGIVEIAKARGYFDQAFAGTGTQVQLQYLIGGGPAINEALAQGQISLAEYGSVPNAVALARDVPAHIVFTNRASGNYYIAVRPDSTVKTLRDLKGKRIAVHKGTNPHLALVRMLESAGLSEKDVDVVNLTLPDQLASFSAHSIDALFGSTTILELRDRGTVRLLSSSADLPPIAGNLSAFLVRNDFLSQYPEATQRIVTALVKASWWASQEQNSKALIALLSEAGGQQKYYEEIYSRPLQGQFTPLIDGFITRGYQSTLRFAVDEKLLRNMPDSGPWFDHRYLDAALKQLNLESYWTPTP